VSDVTKGLLLAGENMPIGAADQFCRLSILASGHWVRCHDYFPIVEFEGLLS